MQLVLQEKDKEKVLKVSTWAWKHAKHMTREHVSTQDLLAREHVSKQGTLEREHVSKQGTLAQEYLSLQGMQGNLVYTTASMFFLRCRLFEKE